MRVRPDTVRRTSIAGSVLGACLGGQVLEEVGGRRPALPLVFGERIRRGGAVLIGLEALKPAGEGLDNDLTNASIRACGLDLD